MKTYEEVEKQLEKLRLRYAESLEKLGWSDPKGFSVAVAKVNECRQQLQAVKELLGLLSEHPELEPLNGMVHPGARVG